MCRIIEKMFIKAIDGRHQQGYSGGKLDSDEILEDSVGIASNSKYKGTLIIDAACVTADIAYPTVTELCDKARRRTEEIIITFGFSTAP